MLGQRLFHTVKNRKVILKQIREESNLYVYTASGFYSVVFCSGYTQKALHSYSRFHLMYRYSIWYLQTFVLPSDGGLRYLILLYCLYSYLAYYFSKACTRKRWQARKHVPRIFFP